jgi:hypothetical protein
MYQSPTIEHLGGTNISVGVGMSAFAVAVVSTIVGIPILAVSVAAVIF